MLVIKFILKKFYSASVIGAIGEIDYQSRKWSLGGHTVSEIDFGNGYKLIDSQADCFYLDYDNETIIDKETATNDKYLMHRTHHGGKTYLNGNNYVDLYDESDSFSTNFNSGHNLDFILKPGCTFEFNWAPAEYFHHLPNHDPEHLLPIIANNHFYYSIPFETQSATDIFFNSQNIITSFDNEIDTSIKIDNPENPANFVLQIDSPFPILCSDILLDYEISDSNTITIEFAEDYGNWSQIADLSSTSIVDSISAAEEIDPLNQSAIYQYYLKFSLQQNSVDSFCSINILSINTTVQSSKFFMPALELGTNSILFEAENDNINASIEINWQESTDNEPPNEITSPIYPENESDIDETKFTFEWEIPEDFENDEIVDYDFELSQRADMKYPLSSNFSWYISTFADNILPQFTIPEDGLLNPGTEYFWHVRAKDSSGFWSNWSETFSFTPHGPNQIEDFSYSNQHLMWQPNNDDNLSTSFLIFGSNIPDGFTPNDDNLIVSSTLTFYDISDFDYNYYRVIAVDIYDNRSIPSFALFVSQENNSEETAFDISNFSVYPNPIRNYANISFETKKDSDVDVDIFNIRGQLVVSLSSSKLSEGRHLITWNTKNNYDKRVASGIYFVNIRTDYSIKSQKIVLLE